MGDGQGTLGLEDEVIGIIGIATHVLFFDTLFMVMKDKDESSDSLANAEIIRAEGVAKANKIIGDSLQNNDACIISGIEVSKGE